MSARTESRGPAREHGGGEGDAPAPLAPAVVEAMRAVRRALHVAPELSHQEVESARLVRRELEAAGVVDLTGVAGTGLVATIRGRAPGRTLVLRADLDALPIQERTGLPFASRRSGVMHACGHDAHTAILVGVARTLQARRAAWTGTVRCVFQPAEELEPLGGREVVRAGCLDGADGALALHVDPTLPVGRVGVRDGPLMACADSLVVRVGGRGSHGAFPHHGIDAIAIAAAVVQQLQTVVSRRVDPLEPVVLTLGTVHGGTRPNILADEVVIEGTLRTLDEGLRGALREMIRAIVAGVAAAHGATGTVEVIPGEPVLRNDPRVAALVREAASAVLGPDGVVEIARPEMVGEDFAFYLERVPGAMFRLGVGNRAAGIGQPLHDARFDLDEDALAVGAAVVLETARRFLAAGEG
jgi:amidohydrolase